jgi:hypothetical protein
MKAVGLAVFGWLVPGGAYLLLRRYLLFAVFAVLVSTTCAAELQGLDTFTALVFQAGALAKLFAGCPVLLAPLFDGAHGFLDGRLHEYGTTLMVLAGLFNLLAVSNALELRKAER